MQDFLGEELKKNDVIVFIENGYRNFKIGVVDKLTEQKVRVEFDSKSGKTDHTYRWPHEVVKYNVVADRYVTPKEDENGG